jgi:hypothetical protein
LTLRFVTLFGKERTINKISGINSFCTRFTKNSHELSILLQLMEIGPWVMLFKKVESEEKQKGQVLTLVAIS